MLSVCLHVEEAEEGEDGERQAEEDAGLPPSPHGEARQRGGQDQVRKDFATHCLPSSPLQDKNTVAGRRGSLHLPII